MAINKRIMKFKILILTASLILIAAACNKSPSTDSTTGSSSGDQTSNQQVQSGTVEIDITSSGFSPANITVKSGTVVTFKNVDSKQHWPASNPHPVHTDLPGFDSQPTGVAPGGSYSFTFTKLGTWGYHDHLAPSNEGHIIVVE